MQDVDPLDLVDGGGGELDGLIATIFDEVEVPANRSVGFYLNLLKEKHSKSALARQLQLLTGLHSASMWAKNLGKWLKCRKDRAKHKGVYSATNWQIFLEKREAQALPPCLCLPQISTALSIGVDAAPVPDDSEATGSWQLGLSPQRL
jgi:hypothetical protein